MIQMEYSTDLNQPKHPWFQNELLLGLCRCALIFAATAMTLWASAKAVDFWVGQKEAINLQVKTRVFAAAGVTTSQAGDAVYEMLEGCIPDHGVGACSATAFDFIGRSTYSSGEKAAARSIVTQAVAEAVGEQ